MKHVAVMRPDGSGAWLCAFPETLSEPAVKAHDQMIFDLGQEVESMRQQLAAALAAIKVKDAVLGDIAECIGAGRLRVASAEAIAIQPDDSALQAFAAKVREQCAQLCLDLQGKMVSGGSSINYWKRNAAPKDCAEAIRNLNELPK